LGIAITALLPFNFLNARSEQARHEMESAANQLELLVNPRSLAPAPKSLRPDTQDERINGEMPAFRPLPLDIRRREALEREIAAVPVSGDDEPASEEQLVRGRSGES
jgi:hypothetical protein